MITSNSELPLLVIKTGKIDERLSTSSSSRVLYRKNSVTNSSGEVYYGGSSGSVAIPFGWESQPGTPKVVFRRETPLPPLTPPPSYLLNPPKTPVRKSSKLKASLLYAVLPKLSTPAGRKSGQSPSSPASSASHSSSSSSSPYLQDREIQFSSARSSFESRRHTEDDDQFGSRKPLPKEDDEIDESHHVSSLCFGFRSRGTNSQSRGCYPHLIKVFLGES